MCYDIDDDPDGDLRELMNAIIVTEDAAKKLNNAELILKWGCVKAENQESNCEEALRVLTREMKRRKLI